MISRLIGLNRRLGVLIGLIRSLGGRLVMGALGLQAAMSCLGEAGYGVVVEGGWFEQVSGEVSSEVSSVRKEEEGVGLCRTAWGIEEAATAAMKLLMTLAGCSFDRGKGEPRERAENGWGVMFLCSAGWCLNGDYNFLAVVCISCGCDEKEADKRKIRLGGWVGKNWLFVLVGL